MKNHKEKLIKVLICDDDKLVIEGLQLILEKRSSFQILESAKNEKELFERLKKTLPDVLLLDMEIEQVSDAGFRILRKIKDQEVYGNLKVLILSGKSANRILVSKTLKLGAFDYLSKNIEPGKLIWSILEAHDNNMPFIQNACNCLGEATLTEKELEVLKLIAKRLNRQEIAEHMNIALRTVDSHKQHIREKLDLHSDIEIMHWIMDCQPEWL